MESPNAHLTADVVLLHRDRMSQQWHVLLIERDYDPYAGHLALPGGYVDPHELPADAARRELLEETGLDLAPGELVQVGLYADPDRDPRGRVISVAYVCELPIMPTPTAGDDARTANWVPVPTALDSALAFDHHRILRDALAHDHVWPFDPDARTDQDPADYTR